MTTPSDKPVFTFTVYASDATDPPTVTCSPAEITVGTSNGLIEFDLATPGFSFDPATPIVFSEPTTDFPDLWAISATQIMMRDRCTHAATLNFTIHVVEDSTGLCLSHDPTIKNQPN
ncbi:hypothetical protein [Roseateles oligotrophus]|uniref:Uncharacterized protein n=1 Tax=Roseateles oligotrophus TaxID=1769250 RepID=A0ABT2YD87_9BURK|nr:hypothetical protein [Roseateles oligotrophus]MCV2367991.1 hypothetical protein [Roseateles oligotrophus]